MIRKADLEQMFRNTAPIAHPNQYPPQQQPQQPPPHHNNAQIKQAQDAEMKRRDELRRKAKHPTNRNVPEGVDDICIGDGVARYRELRDIERTLDATMMRKKLEASDSVFHSRSGRTGTMRIWISNTAENQPWQTGQNDPDTFDFESDTNATYRVKIQGRLLDEGNDEGLEDEEEDEKDPDAMQDDKKPDEAQKPKPFSQFFTSITVDFDRAKSLQPDGFTQIEWKRPEGAQPQDNPFSQIEFERKGDENINVTINLQRYHNPEIFRLSKPMAELLDTDEEDRAGVLMGVWEYARAQNLQQDDDERKFACDSKLKALFNGADSFYFPSLPQLIKPHLTTLPPIQLQYTIRVDKDYLAPSPESGKQPSDPTIYDVQVALEDPLQPLLHSIIRSKQSVDTLKQIQTIDEQIALLMSAVGRSKAKHAFFTSMATDPVAFVKRWFSSQKRDLEVIMGDAARGGGEDASGEEWRRGGADSVWASDTARESVALWLARQSIPKAH